MSVSNGMLSGLDRFSTLLSAVGIPDVKEKLLKCWAPAFDGVNFKGHRDGYDQLDYLADKATQSSQRVLLLQ
ncbi:TPA: hypothetical protein NHK96_001064 [Pseudomonas aeruginosa]|nr:hypothetical protein [Pseudomonas aeruginosa]MBX6872456.1 hypothetical protein [Pseudomonas aeruginosa]QQV96145.1 hypothetical protein HUF04_13155 [Pseudomonas aeruginosa]HBN8289769.1 hypothetical protein [Pseudomonas aeruginosa]HBN9785442.1 hypothetical protein [Pseudomonas aeruginosa]